MNEGVWPEYHLIKYLNQACVILFLYSLIIRAFVGVESVGFDMLKRNTPGFSGF